MIYPETIEDKLGFSVLRVRLAELCRSDLGRHMVGKMSFNTDQLKLENWLNQVNEFKLMIDLQELPEIGDFKDLKPFLQESKAPGSFLSAESFIDIRNTLHAAYALLRFFQQNRAKTPYLFQIAKHLTADTSLTVAIDWVIGPEGEVLDRASSILKGLRSDLLKEENRLRTLVNAVFRRAQKEDWIPEGTSIGVRDGRMVIPIKASYKRHMDGFVHDESSSGQIVYLEPTEALEANNKLRELQNAEKREIVRILTDLTNKLRSNQQEVEGLLKFLSACDFIWAKAKLAITLAANLPELINDSSFSIKKARHPQLIRAFANTERKVVAQNFNFDKDDRIILISGPNAGGKSVALKNLGINQFMLQSGLLPCADADSRFRIFDSLFIDIGDEQSIDNDLSTYSSHLHNMRVMLKRVNENALILIDEFGTGTDPQFGAAIAEAMLAEFVRKKCYGLITTHYSNLKSFAEDHEGCKNAAMRFDMVNLVPLYELDIGRPGSSFALEIAQKTGIPGDVIKAAKAHVGYDQIDTEKLLNKLERQKQVLAEKSNFIKSKEQEVKKLEAEYLQLKSNLESKKSEIIDRAKQEASLLLSKTNQEIEKTIRHIKENKAEKKETKKVRHDLTEFAKKVAVSNKEKVKSPYHLIEGKLEKGDFAIVATSGVVVEIREIKGKSAKVLMGELQSVIKLDKLNKISKKKAKEKSKIVAARSKGLDLNRAMANFSTVMDVRGKRADEVITELSAMLDQALMLNQTQLKIIHGKGSGILRKVIREQLKTYDFVESVADEHIERGGDGVTLVVLR